jgi:hypothetical protein
MHICFELHPEVSVAVLNVSVHREKNRDSFPTPEIRYLGGWTFFSHVLFRISIILNDSVLMLSEMALRAERPRRGVCIVRTIGFFSIEANLFLFYSQY